MNVTDDHCRSVGAGGRRRGLLPARHSAIGRKSLKKKSPARKKKERRIINEAIKQRREPKRRKRCWKPRRRS